MKRIPDFRYVFDRKIVPLGLNDLQDVVRFLKDNGESEEGIDALYITLEYEEDGEACGWRAVAYPYSKTSAFWEHAPYYVQPELSTYEAAYEAADGVVKTTGKEYFKWGAGEWA